ncbi:hypothetical protein [Paraburkholderia kirstenboschensis]|uniref:hypothetical protein n=1 Tax=Paraburkholderia kirstenboschensis TaxID=1245436 RepID=UPI0013E33FA1|nr:hypothetical protein [Paraburkholderia kirstenboschensis]
MDHIDTCRCITMPIERCTSGLPIGTVRREVRRYRERWHDRAAEPCIDERDDERDVSASPSFS